MPSFSPMYRRGGGSGDWLQAVGVLTTAPPRVVGGAMSLKFTVGMSLSAGGGSFEDLLPQSVNVHNLIFIIVAIMVDPSFFLVSLIVQIPLSATIAAA